MTRLKRWLLIRIMVGLTLWLCSCSSYQGPYWLDPSVPPGNQCLTQAGTVETCPK